MWTFCIGVFFYLIGWITQKFPPKEINNWYGYRTRRSMQDQASWDFANDRSAYLIKIIGLILAAIGTAIYYLKLGQEIDVLSCTVLAMAGPIWMIWDIEKDLKEGDY